VTPKELCEACRYILREISAIERQIERIGSIGGPREVSSPTLTGMPSGTNRPDAAQNQRVEGYEQVLLKKRQQAMDLMMQFEKLLEQVGDATDRAILRYYYGCGWTDERIAEEMELTDRTVRGRRKGAIEMKLPA
jgi:DNA-binding NarL/FixJ family response regulator